MVVLISVSLGLSVPELDELLIPGTEALIHVKLVPVVPLVGRYENKVLLQMAGGVRTLVSVGTGFTTTTTLYETSALQPFAVKVYT